MTAKEFLQQYRNAEDSINAELEDISRLRALATNINQALSDSKVQASSEDKIANIVAKIVDMERDVDTNIDDLRVIKANVGYVIRKVPDFRQRNILYLRYICGLKWEQIAVKTNYDYRWVLRLHGQGLQYVDKIINSH